MIVLAVVSQKGGVGKTTVALNLAYAFAQKGRRTLLVDADPQGGIGHSLVGKPKDADGLSEVLSGTARLEDVLIHTRVEALRILTVGHPPWSRIAAWSSAVSSGDALPRLLHDAASAYDLVIVDTPSGFTGPTYGVLAAATHVLTPVQTEPLSIRTVPQLLEVIASLREMGKKVQLTAVVLTMAQLREEMSLSVAQEAWSLFPQDLVLEATVPRDPLFTAASAKGVPLGLLRRRPPPVAAAFDNIVAELEPRLGLVEEATDDDAIPLVD